MKKLTILIIIIFFYIGCEKQQPKVVVLKTYEFDYYTNDDVDEPAIIVDDNEWEIANTEFLEFGEKIKKNDPNFPEKIELHFSIFVNEEGEIDFIKNLKRPELGTEKIVDQFLFNIGEMIAKRKVTPAIKNGKAVKYRREGKIGIETFADSLRLFLPDFLTKMPNFNFNKVDKNEYSVAVEEMPSPIGGIRAIAENVKYPKEAKESGVQGRVYVKAFINEEGDVSAAEVIKGIGSGCDKAAIDAVKNAKFNPGKQDGKPVKVQVSIPILFKLN